MKTIFIVLFAILCHTGSKAQTTIYHPIPDSNCYWNETFWTISGAPENCIVNDHYTLSIGGDTTIGSYVYRKIYRSGYDESPNCLYSGHRYNNVYKGAIRQDSLNKKVYFVPESYAEESILYDFNLKVGDTIPQRYNGGTSNYVQGIDSVLVGSAYRKRFLLSPLNSTNLSDTNFAIIEGVGSTLGLINPIMAAFESGSSLNCFRYSDQNYPATSNCKLTLAMSLPKNQDLSITIYPNPSNSIITLKAENSLTNATLTIINGLGETVELLTNISGQTIIFDRGNLKGGVYFLRMTDGDKLFTDKFIINDN